MEANPEPCGFRVCLHLRSLLPQGRGFREPRRLTNKGTNRQIPTANLKLLGKYVQCIIKGLNASGKLKPQ